MDTISWPLSVFPLVQLGKNNKFTYGYSGARMHVQ